MVPQNRSDWLQRGSGMHQECGVKPHVALTLWRRCVCHCSPPKRAAQHPSRVISIYFYTALTAPADPLLCSVAMWAAVGGAGLFRRPRSMGNSAGVSGHRSPVGRWLLSEVSSILSLHGTCKGEGEPGKCDPEEEEENSWGTLGQGVTTKCGSHQTLPGVLGTSLVCQRAALSGCSSALHLAVQGGGVCCAAVRVNTATAWCQPSRSQDLSTHHTLNIKPANKYNQQGWQNLFSFHSSFVLLTLHGHQQLISCICNSNCNYIKRFALTVSSFDSTVAPEKKLLICTPAAEQNVVDDQAAVCRSTKNPTMWFTQQWYSWTARN